MPVTQRKPAGNSPFGGELERPLVADITRLAEGHEKCVTDFLADLRKQPGSATAFDRLCGSGCDQNKLSKLLFVIRNAVQYDRLAARKKGRKRGTAQNWYDIIGVTRAELKNLPTEVNALASRIESINANSMVGARALLDIRVSGKVDYESIGAALGLYFELPYLLRAYSSVLFKIINSTLKMGGPKRVSRERMFVLELLKYVNSSTGHCYFETVPVS